MTRTSWSARELCGWIVERLSAGARNEIDPDAPFAEHGMDSSALTALAAELAELLDRPISPTVTWRHPSPALLAAHLAGAGVGPDPSSARGVRAGQDHDEPIAIVGLSCRLPGAPDPGAFGELLRSGTMAIRDVPAGRWPGTSARGGFLDRIDAFDATFFGLSPREAAHVDPQQRLILELAWEALADAGIPPGTLGGSRTGVFVGAMWGEYGEGIRADPGLISQHTLSGGDLSIIPARLSYLLGLRGPSLQVNTACSSSLVAVHLAIRALLDGECDLAVVGGVSLMLAEDTFTMLRELGALAPDGRSKAFDARADGYGRGEGGGVVVLKPLARALADGDPIYCALLGSAMNNDGFSNGLTAPSPQAQEDVLRAAYERAGILPRSVQYVETHGTGTKLGDPIEAGALHAVLCDSRPHIGQPLVLGALKANIGHLEAAAGIAGLIKVALSLRHRMLPPLAGLTEPNPLIPFSDWGLRLVRECEHWPADNTGQRLAGVSAFGFGGTNCHVVVADADDDPVELLPLSADTEDELRANLDAIRRDTRPISQLCAQAAAADRQRAHRLALVIRDRHELTTAADTFLAGNDAPNVLHGRYDAPRRTVFSYGGQGSQWYGMGAALLRDEPVFRAAVAACETAFAPYVDFSLVRLLTTERDWTDVTELVQPAIFAMQVALTALWRSWGVEPDAVVGVSMGEVAAAHVAGAIDLDTAALIICRRSRVAGTLRGRGAMAVVALSEADTVALLDTRADQVWIAGVAGPASTVISGEERAVTGIMAELTANSVRCGQIEVSYASHSPYVEDIVPTLRTELAGLTYRPCRLPFYSAATAGLVDGESLDAEHWISTERTPWRFSAAVELLRAAGHDVFLSLDPHPVLREAIQQHGVPVLPSLRRDDRGRHTLFTALGALYAGGLSVPWQRVHPIDQDTPQVLVLSGRSVEAARETARLTADLVEADDGLRLRDICYTAAVRRTHHEHRISVTARSRTELVASLRAAETGQVVTGVSAGHVAPGEPPGVAFVFAGQGSQWPGMGRQLLAEEPVFGAVIQECDELLAPLAGWSVTEELARPSETSRLSRTEIAQPALFAVEVALARLWQSWGVFPAAVLGHSVGEIAAAHVAGALSLPEAINLVHLRGDLMRRATGPGAMVAVDLPETAAAELISEHPDQLAIAAVNDPGSVVVSGAAATVEELVARLEKDGVSWRRLRVAHAFHSPLMEDARREMARLLGDLTPRAGDIPMYSTVTGRRVQGTELDAQYWARNIRATVQFAASVASAAADGHRAFLEIGPHPVLREHLRRCLPASGMAVASLHRAADERESLLRAAGSLHTQGCELRFGRMFDGTERVVALPAYPWQRERHWLSATHPPAEEERDPLADRLYTLQLRSAERDDTEPAPEGYWVVVAGDESIGGPLAEELRARGHACLVASVRNLEQTLAGKDAVAGLVCVGIDAASVPQVARTLLALATREVPRLWLVARAVGERPESVRSAALWGLGRTLALEHPEMTCARVELGAVAQAGEVARLADEVLGPDGERDLAIGDRRRVARLVPLRLAEDSVRLREDVTYLVVGDHEQLGPAVTEWMLARGARHIVRATSENALGHVTDLNRSGPPLSGIVCVDDTVAQSLHERTLDHSLDLFVVCSPASGLFGHPGQPAVAASSAVAAALVRHRRALGLPGLHVSIAPEDLAARGLGAVAAPDVALALGRALTAEVDEIAVLDLNLRHWYESHPSAADLPTLSQVQPQRQVIRASSTPREFAAADVADRPGLLEEHLRLQLALTLQEDPSRLHRLSTFNALGLGSLMAVELRNRLESTLGVRLSATVTFQHATIAALAEHLLGELHLAEPAPREAAPTVTGRAAEPIAIIGMGCRLPGASGPAEFWRLLDEGTDAVTEVPAQRWAHTGAQDGAARWGAFLPAVDGFDAAFFGITPREAKAMDPQQRLLLEVLWEALEDGGVRPSSLAGSRTGVFVGVVVNDYDRVSTSNRDIYTVTGNGHSFPAGRLSYQFDLQGPSMTVDTACSSSLVAVHLACRSLRDGESEMALAGGVNLMLDPDMTGMLVTSGALSPDGRCRTFDSHANGYVRGEGCGMLVLKRLSDAEAAGDPVLAVIRGSSVNSDGRSSGITAPNVSAQKSLLRQAVHDAQVSGEDIGYVETHGTGTPLGDPVEIAALTDVVGRPRADGSVCVLGAVKTNIGHLEAAAGVAGLIKIVLALRHERIPANLHFRTLNPRIELDETALTLATRPVPWPATATRPRLAGVSSFGISGTNAHVIVGEAPAATGTAAEDADVFVVPVSAGDPVALAELTEAYRPLLADGSGLADLAHTAAVRREHHRHRAAFVADSSAVRRIETATGRQSPPRVVFVFPGQGSQWLGMCRELLADEPVFREAVQRCDTAIRRETGWSVIDELAGSPAGIDVIQPVLFAVSVGLAALWRSWGVSPDAVVGHSMGEVAAAHVAGALSLADAARIICRRSRLLRRLSGQGTMAVAELPRPELERVLSGRPGVSVAASNSSRTTVFAGDAGEMDRVVAELTASGVFCRRIKVDVASHSPQVDPLTDELLRQLDGIEPGPLVTAMYSTVTARLGAGDDLDPGYWVRNLRSPVLFADAIEPLIADESTVFLELSPHPILLPAIEDEGGVALPSLRREHGERRVLLESLGALYVLGASVDWSALYPAGRTTALPTYAWQRERYWIDRRRVPSRHEGGHPLLGAPLQIAGQATRVWHGELSAEEPAYLTDHRIDGAVVLPATASVEMALAALGPEWELEDVGFERMAVLSEDSPHQVQFVVTEEERGRVAFQLFGRATAEEDWTRWVNGNARTVASQPPPPEPPAPLRERCTSEVDADGHYTACEERALEYGPAFRGVTALWIGDEEGGGHVRLPVDATNHRCHPALLDACFQLLGGVLIDQRQVARGIALTPVAVRRLRLHRTPGDQVWVRVRLDPGGADAGDLVIVDEQGEVLIEVEGLEVRRLPGRQPYADWLLRVGWPRVDRPSHEDVTGRWVVLADAGGVGTALAEGLRARGASCSLTTPENLHDALSGGGIAGVVDLTTLDIATSAATTADTLMADGHRVAGTLDVARTIVGTRLPDTPRLWLVTQGAQAVGDEIGPVRVAQAPLWGLARTLSVEHPELAAVRVDLDPVWTPELAAGALLAELGVDGEDEVALRASGRHASRVEPAVFDAPAAEPEFGAGTYLITGGLGGLGIDLARWLVDHGATHLVLLGRGAPGTEANAAIEDIRGSGATVLTMRADVTDRAALASVFADVDRRMPPLRGVVHAAMVLDDRTVAELDVECFDRVMAPKVSGAWNLHELTKNRHLDHFVLYSSAATLLGSPGQANYAAANAFLGALARLRRGMGLPALCVDWGLFAEAGHMADRADAGRRLAGRGIGALTPRQGTDILGRLLGGDLTHVAAVDVDFRQWLEFYPALARSSLFTDVGQGGRNPVADSRFTDRLAAAAPDERLRLIEELVRGQLGQVVQLEPDTVDRSVPFTTFGVDSLMALELRNRLEAALGLRLPVTLLFTAPTVASLAEHLLDLAVPTEPESDLAGAGVDELLALIDDSVSRTTKGIRP
ncbi:type I polyketide synthase [Actinosynnema sp. ALI-1.44]|uniref:type I polyketide synthase n=1 Tax=Actinosynnema sp. ALI-1.44 TaxID=1933779 RepID=UPI00143CE8D2|nr:type I polyketide synthase [Actinosynnema sp. ALI-1.44]